MRLARVRTTEGPRSAVVSADQRAVHPLPGDGLTVDDVVRADTATLAEVQAAACAVPAVPLSRVELLPPLGRFNRDILCVGWNYLDHFYESKGRREGQEPERLPGHPTFFTKGPDTVIAAHEAIAFDEQLSKRWDYEAELAVVIGRDGRSIKEEDALSHVFGFCVANDVSQRDLQRAHGGQWLKGKSIDQTMPLGPWITTRDEVEISDLTISCELNGHLVQRASAADMIFPVERIIAELSRGMTLRAGDIILTGTPSGIGNARTPPLYLRDRDVLVTRISTLGELRNPVVAAALV